MSHDTAAWRHAEVWVGEDLVLVKIRYREWRMKSPPPVPVCDLIVTVRDRPELLWSAHRTMDICRIFALKTRIEHYLTRVAGKYTVEQLFEKKSKPACLVRSSFFWKPNDHEVATGFWPARGASRGSSGAARRRSSSLKR